MGLRTGRRRTTDERRLARLRGAPSRHPPPGSCFPLTSQPPGGEAEYTPLRRVVFVTWKEERQARALRSTEEIRQAVRQGAVQLATPGIVVNMRMRTRPGGR